MRNLLYGMIALSVDCFQAAKCTPATDEFASSLPRRTSVRSRVMQRYGAAAAGKASR